MRHNLQQCRLCRFLRSAGISATLMKIQWMHIDCFFIRITISGSFTIEEEYALIPGTIASAASERLLQEICLIGLLVYDLADIFRHI